MRFSTAFIAALAACTNLAIAAPLDVPAGVLTVRNPEPANRGGQAYEGDYISMACSSIPFMKVLTAW